MTRRCVAVAALAGILVIVGLSCVTRPERPVRATRIQLHQPGGGPIDAKRALAIAKGLALIERGARKAGDRAPRLLPIPGDGACIGAVTCKDLHRDGYNRVRKCSAGDGPECTYYEVAVEVSEDPGVVYHYCVAEDGSSAGRCRYESF